LHLSPLLIEHSTDKEKTRQAKAKDKKPFWLSRKILQGISVRQAVPCPNHYRSADFSKYSIEYQKNMRDFSRGRSFDFCQDIDLVIFYLI